MDIFKVDDKDLFLFFNFKEAAIFNYAVALLCLSEIAIWIYTSFSERKHNRDISIWFVIGAWVWGVSAGKVLRGADMPDFIQNLLFPHFIYYLGIILIVIGVMIRCAAVITLRHAFTHNVQTSENQHLIQHGLYKCVRNPAYTGSILSLIGVTFSYRSVAAFISVVFVSAFCYGLRIKVEEKALQKQFGSAFDIYCNKVKYRLFPRIY